MYTSKFFSFIASVVDTADSFHSRKSPQIFDKIRNGPNGTLRGPGDTDSWNILEAENLWSDSLQLNVYGMKKEQYWPIACERQRQNEALSLVVCLHGAPTCFEGLTLVFIIYGYYVCKAALSL
jgi:hypothetical protein